MTTDKHMSIKLTAGELEAIQWALDPMGDHWCTDDGAAERNGVVFDQAALPSLVGDKFLQSSNKDIADDLIYRVTQQYPDAASAESAAIRRAAQRTANSLAKKLRGNI